ncbi:hypothetical protein ACIPPQ_01630 [Sphingopyxis sp. LARHCG72]
MNYLRLLGGILLTLVIIVFGLVRFAFTIIGASTTPEDYAALKKRMPDMLNWLFTTPWPVPTLLLIAAAAVAAWLLWSGTRKTVESAQAGPDGLNEERVRQIVREETPATDGSPLLYDDSDIREQMTALANAIEGISSRLDTQQSSIARIRSTANFVEAIERAKIAAKLLPGIERARELHSAKRGSSIGTGGRKGPHAEVTRLLPYLGAKASGLENAIKRRTEAITADGVTHTILPEEAGIWADGAKKRAWLIEDAKMEEMIAMLKRVIGDASTPEVFLMNQRIEMDQ